MAQFLIFFLLFIVSFFNISFLGMELEAQKVLVSEIGILALFLVTLFTNRLQIQWRSLQGICCLMLFVLTLIDIFFFSSSISLFGNIFRMQGIFLIWFLLLFSFLSKTYSLKSFPYWIYTLVLLAQAVLLFVFPVNESNRYTGTFGEPNALAAFAVFILPFSFFAIKKFGKKEIFILLFNTLLVGVILFFSGSRSAAIAAGMQIIFLVLYKFHVSLKKIVIFCLLCYFVSYSLPFFQHNFYENRTEIWQAAVVAGWEKPFLGWGIGNEEKALHAVAEKMRLTIKDSVVDSSHNLFLDWWVMGGIVGLGVFLGLIASTLINFINHKQIQNILLMLGIITCLSFNPASVVGLLGLWWLIGQSDI